MPTKSFSQADYQNAFKSSREIQLLAYEKALDIRKYEIELYWKRASYFWTINAAAIAGFVALQTRDFDRQVDMTVLLSCIGIVFSFGWLCVNRGSKFWQENWEFHVDMLEDDFVGPLYKVVMSRAKPKRLASKIQHVFVGPSSYSVSKINQLISLFVLILWITLLFYSLPPFDLDQPFDAFYVVDIGLSIVFCLLFVTFGRTYSGGLRHRASRRTARIGKPTSSQLATGSLAETGVDQS